MATGSRRHSISTWKDENGNIVVTSSPPPGADAQKSGQEREVIRTGEDRPGTKEPAPALRSDKLMPASRTRQATPANENRSNRGERSYRDIKVIMYRTDWCPYCKQASQYLNSLGVTLTEYDIEQDTSKAEEMHQKGGRGVPLIDIEGILLNGYGADAIKAAVEKRRKSSS
jgi:glutaredoxin